MDTFFQWGAMLVDADRAMVIVTVVLVQLLKLALPSPPTETLGAAPKKWEVVQGWKWFFPLIAFLLGIILSVFLGATKGIPWTLRIRVGLETGAYAIAAWELYKAYLRPIFIKKGQEGLANISLVFFLLILLAAFSATIAVAELSAEKQAEYKRLEKAWTPEVRDSFIEKAKQAGCFDRKIVRWIDPDGKPRSMGCYSANMHYDKAAGKWIVECEPLSRRVAPECYEATDVR
jgi:hypothetical protein